MNTVARRYLFGVKCRLRGRHPVRFVRAWQGQCLRRLFKVGFRDQPNPGAEPVDVVIPTVAKDESLLGAVIEGVRRFLGHPVRKVLIIAPPGAAVATLCHAEGCTLLDERSLLGYGKERVDYRVNGHDRSGWLFQQLLKFAAEGVVEREDYFVIDSDTVLINRHVLGGAGRRAFLASDEWHQPYLDSFERLFPYEPPAALSYTSHMMMFNRTRVREMQSELQNRHGAPWDVVIRQSIDSREQSSFSEYNTYANWMLHRHPSEFVSRVFYNRSMPRSALDTLETLHRTYGGRAKSLSFHNYAG